ncbi:MAG: acyl-CoA desaturase [Chlamydiae bacterium]|nr:acyl-CoA desaturase [Chlamydiota bacterium]
MLISTAVLGYITGLSITVGYHRLYSHMTYKTKPIVESILLFFGCMAIEGSALKWSYDHRKHHAFVDTDKDPYSIKKGFWYAHILWIFEKPDPIDTKVVSDLTKNRLVMFQHNYYVPLMFATNILAVVVGGIFFKDMFGSFLFIWLVRMFCIHHLTWFINSLAHTWGNRTYSQELSAVDNFIIALLTLGEGYHNYHHTFAYDYRNGIKWYHFDPSKWIIWTLSKMGLATRLRKNERYFIEERILLDKKKLVLEILQSSYQEQKEGLKESIQSLSEAAQRKLKDLRDLSEKYSSLKRTSQKHDLKMQIKNAKKECSQLMKSWKAASNQVLASSK